MWMDDDGAVSNGDKEREHAAINEKVTKHKRSTPSMPSSWWLMVLLGQGRHLGLGVTFDLYGDGAANQGQLNMAAL